MSIVTTARAIADEVLFPAALAVDEADTLPATNLDAVAGAGLFGAFVPPPLGGPGIDIPDLCAVIEELAGGCLATTFVWIQHFGLLGSLLGDAGGELGQRWLAAAVAGEIKGGIALAGLQPGPPQLVAEPEPDGWRLTGSSRWVTGWGIIDLLQLVARTANGTTVTLVMDATEQPGLTVIPQRLVAANASRTVQLDFDNVTVAADRFVSEAPYDEAAFLATDRLTLTGSLALGVAARCCRLIGPSLLDDELAACRAALGEADGNDAVFAARAAASELAVRSAAALAVHTGSSASIVGQHAPRLMREAMFLLVFGSRPGIRAALVDRLGAVRR